MNVVLSTEDVYFLDAVLEEAGRIDVHDLTDSELDNWRTRCAELRTKLGEAK